MSNRLKRVMKEITDCRKDNDSSQIEIETVAEDLSKLIGRFPGPINSPYEGGTFEVSIEIPQRYPFEPLKMKFITKVYHPNISSQSGAICLDILKEAWSPVLTLKTTLVSLQSLLCSPEPNDPQDAEVARVYLADKEAYERTATYWTEIYAKRRPSITNPITQPNPSTTSSQSSSSPTINSSTTSTRVQPEKNNIEEEAQREIEYLNLNPAYVRQFELMGFPRSNIIHVMDQLDFRGINVSVLGEESVIEALLTL